MAVVVGRGSPSDLRRRLQDDGHPVAFAGIFRGLAVAVVDRWSTHKLPEVRDDFVVLALVIAFNEADIMEDTLDYLTRNELAVYVIDNWSTDGTYEVARNRLGAGVVAVERFPADGGQGRYEWGRLLHRAQEIAAKQEADWFVLHDVDERRSPPWADCTLREGLWRVEQLGYNAVDHAVIEFHPTDDRFRAKDNLEATLQGWAPPSVGANTVQIKAWRSGPVDLVSSGGHHATFPGQRVFPYSFLLKHYPIRSQTHGEQKVLRDRKPRFLPEERLAHRWHTHYDHIRAGHRFLKQPRMLEAWSEDFSEAHLVERLSGIGLEAVPPGAFWRRPLLGLANLLRIGPLLRAGRRRYRIARRRSAETGHR